MMTTIETYVRRGRTGMKKLAANQTLRETFRVGGYFASGFLLSAGSLGRSCQPMAMGLVCALSGWRAALAALGGAAGYLLLWGGDGLQGLMWLALALPVALLLGGRRILDDSPYLMMAVASLIVAFSGLVFQLRMGDTTSVGVYFLRVGTGTLTAKLFEVVRGRRDPAADWMAQAVAVLCFARIVPFGLSLGYVAAGLLAVVGSFPAVALGGLALDLAMICRTPMTAALCLSYLARMLPAGQRWLRYISPCAMYLVVMAMGGNGETVPFWGLAMGGLLGVLVPPGPSLTYRRGETGTAQVRLELMANCLAETQQLLLEELPVPIDEQALLDRAKERACGSCPNRKTCRERLEPFSAPMLHTPYMETGDLTVSCKKPGRLVQELRRAQEQYRILKADRERQTEYREAVIQQYQFLGNFLRQQSDLLPRRADRLRQRYQPEVSICSSGRDRVNGDRCIWFNGPGCRYYVLICDGMGTGMGAAREGDSAASLLRQMLTAGFPAEYALRSLNSLMVLRGRAGAVTVDLAELHLDSGRAVIYKWGAAPSYFVYDGGAEKIGTAGPPPGLSMKETRETVDRLSLRRGEVLILVSDGVDGEAALRRMKRPEPMPPGELAAKILELGARNGEDDATVAAVRLFPGTSSK